MLRIVSKASSVESFVQLFRRFCDRESVFIATRTPKNVGTRTRFTVNLSTGAPMIAGQGEVTEAYRDRDNPYGRPGMRLCFLELNEPSRQTIERLVTDPAPAAHAPSLPGLPSASPHGDGDTQIDQMLGTLPTEPHLQSESAQPFAPPEQGQDENRTQGSNVILPANPFGELSNESLEAFVECAMYEDIVSDMAQPDQDANGHRAVTWWPPTGQSSALLPTGAVGSTGQVSSVLSPQTSQPSGPQQHGFQERRRTSAVQAATPAPAQGKVMHTAMIVHSKRTSPMRIIISAILLSTVVGLGVGYLLWGSARKSAAVPPGERAGATAVATSSAQDGGAQERVPDTTPDTTGEGSADGGSGQGDEATSARQGTLPAEAGGDESGEANREAAEECAALILSRPDETAVFLGDRKLGDTPLKTTLPCGRTEFVFKRVRYENVTEVANLEPGKPTRVTVRLHRPRITLEVTSTPPEAMVIVDRKRVGKTPLEVEISGFSRAVVVVRKSGYRRFRTRIYPKPPGEKIHAELSRRR